MQTEIEAKFIDVDFEALRARLKAEGATLEQPMRLMRRVIIEPAYLKEHGLDAFIRIRDEGHKVTMTYKEFTENTLTGAKEREVTVSDFEGTIEILKSVGLDYRSYQESRRETWRLDDAEIVLDEWPWLIPYIEIEGPSEESVRQTAHRLGFAWDDAVFGSADTVYKIQYPDARNRGVIDIKEVRFDMPLPEELGKPV